MTAEADRGRHFGIARGSTLECAAIQDVLIVGKAVKKKESRELTVESDRMAGMLSRLGNRGFPVQENPAGCEVDPGFDSEVDPDKTNLPARRRAQRGQAAWVSSPMSEPTHGSDQSIGSVARALAVSTPPGKAA